MALKEGQRQSLEQKPVGKVLWEFAAPSIIAMSASSIYNISDSVFIGQHSGPLAIAGMAITFPLMNILTAFSIIASVGGGALTSIYMGRKERSTTHHILGNVLFINLVCSVALCLLGLIFLDPILRAFGASDATLPYARSYMRVILMGVPVTHVFQSLLSLLRASGKPRFAMSAQLLAVVLNVCLDLLFIFGHDLGIAGAAMATVYAQVYALLLIIPSFFDRRSYVFFSHHVLHIRWEYIKNIVSIGISPFISNISGFLIVMVVNLKLVYYGGDLYVGAFGITNRITQLLIMAVSGFSQGMGPIVGYNLGARNFDRVKAVLRLSLTIATTITTIGYLLIAIFPQQLTSLFTTESQMIDVCVPALRIALITFPVVGSQLIAVSFFQSIHKPKLSILINLSRQLLFLLPMLFLLPSLIGVTGVWWSMSLADCFSVILTWVLLRKVIRSLAA